MANILSPEAEAQLNKMISNLEAKNGTEMAVVTVLETQPANSTAYSEISWSHESSSSWSSDSGGNYGGESSSSWSSDSGGNCSSGSDFGGGMSDGGGAGGSW